MSRPKNKQFSEYMARQVKRFKLDGWKDPDIAARMGISKSDVRRLGQTPRVKPLPATLKLILPPLPRSLPVRDENSGRSYARAPRRSA